MLVGRGDQLKTITHTGNPSRLNLKDMKSFSKMVAAAVALVSLYFMYFIHPLTYLIVCSCGVAYLSFKVLRILYPTPFRVDFNFKRFYSPLLNRLQTFLKSESLITTQEIG